MKCVNNRLYLPIDEITLLVNVKDNFVFCKWKRKMTKRREILENMHRTINFDKLFRAVTNIVRYLKNIQRLFSNIFKFVKIFVKVAKGWTIVQKTNLLLSSEGYVQARPRNWLFGMSYIELNVGGLSIRLCWTHLTKYTDRQDLCNWWEPIDFQSLWVS